jgi:chromosome segregation protein
MRLNSIKLSGFKSFAEPTHFQLPGQLVGVVGPNGCGKSNIMDAVRWVLGESKASELRGESMQDVIFNGSGNRKPASRSSVELVFSNEDARAGGQWNQFAEIAVKRVLTRDGTSSYFINNQPVRRRDVQDVFLGTGLGPRAYAIIGQGTISRIIESKPEELRLFLEEAAGVSKYKERRRETENRLKDTRENLTRVEDILRELNNNLDKLEKQAEVATRYHALQEQGTLKLHQLWFLKHRDAATEETRIRLAVAEATNALEARLAELRGVEAQLEQVRQDHYAASDALHLAQGELAEANLAVSRLEERIRYVVEGRQKVEQRLAELKGQNEQWLERRSAAEFELEELAEKMLAAEEQAEILAAQSEELAGNLPSFEDAVRSATQRANTQRGVAGQVQQQIQLLAAESRNIDDQSRQFTLRRERLSSEKHALGSPDEARLTDLKRQLEAVQEELALSEAQLGELTEEVPELDEARKAQQHESQTQAARQAELTARLEALRALQEKVQTEGKLKPWLAKHGLDSLQGLWRKVHIEPGWEIALESALRERLSALEVGRVETVRAFEQDAPPAKLAFYSLPQAGIQNTHTTLPRLSDQLRLQDASLKALMNDWLEGVYTAANLEEALANRQRLTHGEVIMTRAGHTVSQFAVSFYAPDSEQAGMLARAQEIESLDKQVRAQALIAEDARASLIRAEAHYTDASQRLATTRRQTSEVQQRAHQLQVEVLRLAQQAEQAQARHGQIAEELAEIDAQLDELQERRATGEARFEELDLSLADAQEQHAQLEEAVMEAERKLNQAREQARAQERQAQEAQFSARAMASRRGELQRSIETSAQQIQLNEASVAQLHEEQARLSDASAHTGLDEALAVRVEKEGLLAQARTHYDDLSAQLRRADEQRMGFERSLQPLRDEITKLQLEQQAATLGGAQFLEQLTAAEVDLAALADSHRARRHQALWPADRDRPHPARDQCPGRGEPGRLGRADRCPRAQGLPRLANGRPERRHRRRWKTRSTRSTWRRATCWAPPSTPSTSISGACSPACLAGAVRAW